MWCPLQDKEGARTASVGQAGIASSARGVDGLAQQVAGGRGCTAPSAGCVQPTGAPALPNEPTCWHGDCILLLLSRKAGSGAGIICPQGEQEGQQRAQPTGKRFRHFGAKPAGQGKGAGVMTAPSNACLIWQQQGTSWQQHTVHSSSSSCCSSSSSKRGSSAPGEHAQSCQHEGLTRRAAAGPGCLLIFAAHLLDKLQHHLRSLLQSVSQSGRHGIA